MVIYEVSADRVPLAFTGSIAEAKRLIREKWPHAGTQRHVLVTKAEWLKLLNKLAEPK